MSRRHRLRRASIVAGASAALLLAAHPAAAAPTDTVFPIPVAGLGVGVTGLLSPGYFYLTATTDTDTPGVTRFGPYTGVHVHWRNLSSGAAGVAYINNRYGTPVETGSGTVAAVVTISDAIGYRILASTPGAGAWTVP